MHFRQTPSHSPDVLEMANTPHILRHISQDSIPLRTYFPLNLSKLEITIESASESESKRERRFECGGRWVYSSQFSIQRFHLLMQMNSLITLPNGWFNESFSFNTMEYDCFSSLFVHKHWDFMGNQVFPHIFSIISSSLLQQQTQIIFDRWFSCFFSRIFFRGGNTQNKNEEKTI